MTDETRVERALSDVVAVERLAPGLVNVVTWSDSYVVDARGEGCTCPDKQYNLQPGEKCKHHAAALMATTDTPAPFDVVDSLSEHGGPTPILTDGGAGVWTVADTENGNTKTFDSRSEAEGAVGDMESLGVDVELRPPGTDTAQQQETGDKDEKQQQPETDGGKAAEVVDTVDDVDTDTLNDLPERSVAEDPLTWVPADFVDTIDGTQAINRKGFEVLSYFYNINVHATLEVPPEDTGFEHCRVKACATTEDGRQCEAFGSSHVNRNDDPELLLEMADTRARKRALSIATGVGAVAVAELRNEVEQ